MEKYFKDIEQKRQQIGMTIQELCDKVGISPMAYYNAKSYKAVIGAKTFMLLNKEVGIKTIEL